MNFVLIGLHAMLGELGSLAFLWCLVETLDLTPTRLKRARLAALMRALSVPSETIRPAQTLSMISSLVTTRSRF